MNHQAASDRLLQQVDSWDAFRRSVNSLEGKKAKGDAFERLIQIFLGLHPEYQWQTQDVWLYDEIPGALKKELNLPTKDRGVDLLVKTKAGEYWTVQAKYRKNRSGCIPFGELGTFGSQTAAIGRGITRGLICATKREKTQDFVEATFDFRHVLLDTWESLEDGFWKQVREEAKGGTPKPLKPYTPDPHQEVAIEDTRQHFVDKDQSRGKLIMACGTGKTLVGYWIVNRALEARNVVIALPTLDLVKQTFRSWAREAAAEKRALDVLIVCSDQSTAKDKDDDSSVDEIPALVTTDPNTISDWLQKPTNGALRVVFVTYHSGPVLAKATPRRFEFDVGLFDEAHKTAGTKGKKYQHLLYQKNIRIRKRIFMTATERYYHGEKDDIVGMNDKRAYGDRYHYLSFGKAIDDGLLADYSLVCFGFQKSESEKYSDLVQERVYVETDLDLPPLTADHLATAVALRKALKTYDLGHAISFHSRNDSAKLFQRVTEALNGLRLSKRLKTFRVRSGMSSGSRHEEIKAFERSEPALISNARLLGEGVDVPAIDLVLFADPKESKVDIVQAVGRALRKPRGESKKEKGYILAPILLEDEETDLETLEDSAGFENLVSVLKAMAAVDEEGIRERVHVVLSAPRKGRASRTSVEAEVLMQRLGVTELSEALKLMAFDRMDGLYKSRLTIQKILAWADDHYAQTSPGEWPSASSGNVLGVPNETWVGINTALGRGTRGLPGGSSLANVLKQERSVINVQNLPELTEEWIIDRIKYHYEQTGKYPNTASGPLLDYPHEHWKNTIDKSLRGGGEYRKRGLAGGSSLSRFIYEHFGIKGLNWKLEITDEEIIENAKAFREQHGRWPTADTGKRLPPHLSWGAINLHLSKFKGSSLSKVLRPIKDEYERQNPRWRPFEEAREFVRSLGLRTQNDWMAWTRTDERPPDIPVYPLRQYKDQGWIGMPDWLGTQIQFWTYDECREFASSLNLNSEAEWKALKRAGELPKEAPYNPNRSYAEKGWEDWYHFLGKGRQSEEKAVRCETTGERFSSVTKAAKALGKPLTTVSLAIHQRRPICDRVLVFEDEKNYR